MKKEGKKKRTEGRKAGRKKGKKERKKKKKKTNNINNNNNNNNIVHTIKKKKNGQNVIDQTRKRNPLFQLCVPSPSSTITPITATYLFRSEIIEGVAGQEMHRLYAVVQLLPGNSPVCQ